MAQIIINDKIVETLLPLIETGFKMLMPILDSIFSVLGFITDVLVMLKPITVTAEGITYIYDEFGKVIVIATILAGLAGLKLASIVLGKSMGIFW